MTRAALVLAFALLWFSMVSSGGNAYAETKKFCPNLISLVRQAAQSRDFPALQAIPLSDAEKTVLQTHAIAEFAKKYRGQPVVFQSMHFGEKMDSLYKGEWVQARFMRSVLEELFPKARFTTELPKTPSSSEKVFELQMADFSEISLEERMNPSSFVKVPQINEPYVIPLHYSKPLGSRRAVPLTRAEIRKRLGIPARQKVVSLYVRAPDTIVDTQYRGAYADQDITKLITNLREEFPFDTVILTFGNYDREVPGSVARTFLFESKPALQKIQLVSEAKAAPGVVEPKTLLMNDTTGLLPYLHRAADLSVVVGPVNFFEPLRAGTKTLLVKKRGSLSRNSNYGSYDKEVLENLAKFGEQTGAMVSVDEYSEIPAAIKKLNKLKPAASLDAISEAIFPRILDSIHGHLKYLETNFKKP